jgi:hypothetical protein
MASPSPDPTYRYKHILIVHGIGDQVPNETSLNFMNNFLRALPEGEGYTLDVDNLIESVDPPTISAGRAPARFQPAFVKFHCNTTQLQGDFLIGFSEVYWQDITNGFLDKNDNAPPIPIFVWAHSINTRLLKHGFLYHTAREAIDNLEVLLKIARKLSILYQKSGTLVNILNRFLGDVQMYAESDTIRGEINQRFKDVASRVQQHKADLEARFSLAGPPEIYVVAHSEGTVVSYSSLVEAAAEGLPWFRQVQGLVTLGSPIDKHYTIWHNRFRTDSYSGPASGPKIPWFNYWDVSDPVGYGLRVLQRETPAHPPTDADQLFSIRYDTPFIRYPVPGLAHVEYWEDRELHQHIIRHVMGLGPPGASVEPLKNAWFGKWHIQDLVDRGSYVLGRLAAVAAIAYFLARLAGPLPSEWRQIWPFEALSLESLTLLLTPLAVWLFLWKIFTAVRGAGATAALWLRWVVWVGWLAILAMFSLRLSFDYPAKDAAQIKDMLGYATGLATAVLAWQMHTRVHKGIVQLWRYTKGLQSSAKTEPAETRGRTAIA